MSAIGPYRALLRPRALRSVFVASLAGRLPAGMLSLSVLLLVRSATGSYAVAGGAVAAYNIAVAGAVPASGRLADRLGLRRALAICGVTQPLALLALALASRVTRDPVALVLAAGLAGAALPAPIASCMRGIWAAEVAGERQTTAFALEAVVTEAVFIAGPLLVAALAAAGGPTLPVLAASALAAGGALAMALAAPASSSRATAGTGRGPGPLRRSTFRILFAFAIADAAALGMLELAVAGRATEAGAPALTGVLLAVLACGSLVGGLCFGAREWSRPAAEQYPRLLFLLACAVTPAALVSGVPALALVLAFSGALLAPLGAVQGRLVAGLAPQDGRAEAFAWISAASFAGYSCGSALGGAVVARAGSAAGLAGAVAITAIAAIAALGCSRRLGAIARERG